MNSKEIILANIEHRNPLRPGLVFDGRISDFTWGGISIKNFQEKRYTEDNFEYYNDIWGNLWRRMNNGCAKGEIFQAFIAEWSDLDKIKIPEPDEASIQNIKDHHGKESDKFKLVGMPGWVFADARYLRKLEIYLMDMALYPDELKRMHAIIASFYKKCITIAGKAEADGIMFYEDLGTQNGLLFSPEMWDEYFKDIYTELFELAHSFNLKVIMHSCGQNTKIIERLLKAGVDCLQFDQPTVYDPAILAPLLKKYKAALWSPIDIQKILPTGNRELIEKGVDDMIKNYGGGLIFGSYGDLPGIGVKPEWDQWAYEKIIGYCGLTA